ncbi:MAG: rod-binding protein [Bdellovibrionales bacterium]|nr:rod-binding protein [Bdellovibrionales bacterium]
MKIEAPVVTPAVSEKDKAGLQAVSRQFESLLVNQLVKTMRETVGHDGVIPQGQAEKVYQSMLDTEYAKQISETGSMGLGDMLYRHMLQTLEGQ